MYLIAGLGNPDRKYLNTRHNFGYIVIQALSYQWNLPIQSKNTKAHYADGIWSNHRILLVQPTTYMNNSGEAIAFFRQYYKIPDHKIIILYDDMDLSFSQIRISVSKSDGGHRGIRSIIQHTKTTDFIRIRLGIGRPPDQMDTVAYVLSSFWEAEKHVLDEVIKKATNAIVCIIKQSLQQAMNEYNKRNRTSISKSLDE